MRNREIRNGDSSFQTGDINLAAALIACGVPPSDGDPVTVIQPEHGPAYGSFRLGSITADGKDLTAHLMEAWNHQRDMGEWHGFTIISEFIKARPKDCRHTDEMLDFAIDYLRAMGESTAGIAELRDIPSFVERDRNTAAAFILAFVWQRDDLFKTFRNAKTDFYLSRGTGRDMRQAMISDNLPRWQRRELTSRLQG